MNPVNYLSELKKKHLEEKRNLDKEFVFLMTNTFKPEVLEEHFNKVYNIQKIHFKQLEEAEEVYYNYSVLNPIKNMLEHRKFSVNFIYNPNWNSLVININEHFFFIKEKEKFSNIFIITSDKIYKILENKDIISFFSSQKCILGGSQKN